MFVINLFAALSLETLANILEVIGFGISIITILITLRVKSEVENLKTQYILDQTISRHIQSLTSFTQRINRLLDDYDTNRPEIQINLNKLQPELEDVARKLNKEQNINIYNLIKRVNAKRNGSFVVREYNMSKIEQYLSLLGFEYSKTTYDDIWNIHVETHKLITELSLIQSNEAIRLRT